MFARVHDGVVLLCMARLHCVTGMSLWRASNNNPVPRKVGREVGA